MVFNKSLNSTQISNVSESITGLPYVGNVFYENGLITVTSPKHNSSLLANNTITSSLVTIGPTVGNVNNFTEFAIDTSATVAFKSVISAFTSSFAHRNEVFTPSTFPAIPESTRIVVSTDTLGSNIGNTLKYELRLDSASSENYSVQAFSAKPFMNSAFHIPAFSQLDPILFPFGGALPGSNISGFTPSGSCSITSNTSKFILSASADAPSTSFATFKAINSQSRVEDNFPTSDTTLSDTVFQFTEGTSDSGSVYLADFNIDGLAMSGSLENIPDYTSNGAVINTISLNGLSSPNDTLVSLNSINLNGNPLTTSTNNLANDGIEISLSTNALLIKSVPSDVTPNVQFSINPKFTNTSTSRFKTAEISLRSGSTTIVSQSFSVPPSATTPISLGSITHNTNIATNDSYSIFADLGGESSLTMTECPFLIKEQNPTGGKRNKVALIDAMFPFRSLNNNKSFRYLVKFDEVHTSSSNQGSGPNHNGLISSSLLIQLKTVGTRPSKSNPGTFVTEDVIITSSIYNPMVSSGSFIHLINPGDLTPEGTEDYFLDSDQILTTLIKVIPSGTAFTPGTETLESFEGGEGFTLKNFSILEISGSTQVDNATGITGTEVGKTLSFTDGTTAFTLPSSASISASSAVVNSISPIILNRPILTIDSTGSAIFRSASVLGDPSGFVSASFTINTPEPGIFLGTGLNIDTNFDSGKNIRMRIFSGSTLVTSSVNQSSLSLGTGYTETSIDDLAPNNSTGSGANITLGFLSASTPIRIDLDVVDNGNSSISISPSFSASFSNLGIHYLTASNFIINKANTGIGGGSTGFAIDQAYNQIRIDSTATSPPFTNGAITQSTSEVNEPSAENFGFITTTTTLGPGILFLTSSMPATYHQVTTPRPLVIERDIDLSSNRRYEITQSLLFTTSSTDTDKVYVRMFRKGGVQSFGSFGSFNVPSPTEGGDFPGPKITTQAFTGIENTLEEFKGTVDIASNQAGTYTIQLYYGTGSTSNFTFDNLPDETSDVVVHLTSASLKEFAPTASITRISGDAFTSADVSNIRVKTAEGNFFTAQNSNILLETGSNQIHVSTSFANENGLLLPPVDSFNEFTVDNTNKIGLNNGEIFIINGEITASNNNTFLYFTPTSSLNIVGGFNSDMEGGSFTDAIQGDFLITSAPTNTFIVNQNYFSTTNQTFTINYIDPTSISNFDLKFKNTHLIFENEYMCTVEEDEYNFTLNPTVRKLQSIHGDELADFATGSNFKPYVTTIGLYSDDGELLVVGKLGQPIKMSDETDTTFIVRYDT
tara:strand:- start:529 stop:4386 length:3858 start_codon:yes stop_codon:yes gene_type:complete